MTLKYENYVLTVSDISSCDEISENFDNIITAANESFTAAVIFMLSDTFKSDNFTKLYEKFCSVSFITIAAAENMQNINTEFLMIFDIRLSSSPIQIIKKEYHISCFDFYKRYRLLFGQKATLTLKNAALGDKVENANFVKIVSPENFQENAISYAVSLFEGNPEYQITSLISCFKVIKTAGKKEAFREEAMQFCNIIEQMGKEKQNG